MEARQLKRILRCGPSQSERGKTWCCSSSWGGGGETYLRQPWSPEQAETQKTLKEASGWRKTKEVGSNRDVAPDHRRWLGVFYLLLCSLIRPLVNSQQTLCWLLWMRHLIKARLNHFVMGADPLDGFHLRRAGSLRGDPLIHYNRMEQGHLRELIAMRRVFSCSRNLHDLEWQIIRLHTENLFLRAAAHWWDGGGVVGHCCTAKELDYYVCNYIYILLLHLTSTWYFISSFLNWFKHIFSPEGGAI